MPLVARCFDQDGAVWVYSNRRIFGLFDCQSSRWLAPADRVTIAQVRQGQPGLQHLRGDSVLFWDDAIGRGAIGRTQGDKLARMPI